MKRKEEAGLDGKRTQRALGLHSLWPSTLPCLQQRECVQVAAWDVALRAGTALHAGQGMEVVRVFFELSRRNCE